MKMSSLSWVYSICMLHNDDVNDVIVYSVEIWYQCE